MASSPVTSSTSGRTLQHDTTVNPGNFNIPSQSSNNTTDPTMNDVAKASPSTGNNLNHISSPLDNLNDSDSRNNSSPIAFPQSSCDCAARLPFLALGAPTTGRVDLPAILTNGETLITSWSKACNCRNCSSDPAQLHLFYLATQRQVALYEAAAAQFGFSTPQHSGRSTPVAASVECAKAPASLGDVALDPEETTALGRTILSKAFVAFVKFLSQLGMAFRRMPGNLPIDSPEGNIHQMTGCMLKCITKTRMGAGGIGD